MSDADRIYGTYKQFSYSLKWFDHDGIENLVGVRSDDLDEVFRGISRVRTSISVPTAKPEPQALEPSRNGAEGDGPWLTTQQLVERVDSFTYWQMRLLLQRREQNGLAPCVRKIGRRLLISESGFRQWFHRQPHR